MLNNVTNFCFVIIIYLHLCNGLFKPSNFYLKKSNKNKNGLILTDLIKQNNIREAKNAARVTLDGAQNIVSYAAYLTVNAEYDSNIFFWFFPSRNNYNNAPVILWLQGDPGVSSLFGLFVEHGPFLVTNDLRLQRRNKTWIETHSVIYMDHAVGTGFSFGDKQKGTELIDVGKDLYEALLQFFQLFPELQDTDFFISGESYTGLYGPALGYTIMKNSNSKIHIPLKGLIIGNGFVDPNNQLNYGDFLFGHGLIDRREIAAFNCDATEAKTYLVLKRYKMATNIRKKIFERYANLTNLNLFNYIDDLKTLRALENNYKKYIQQPSIRREVHVGENPFDEVTSIDSLSSTRSQSAAPWIIKLLNNYRILIYTGNLDVMVNYMTVMNYLEHLKFVEKGVFENAIRNHYIIDEDVAGYVRVVKSLTEVLVRNAGHMVPFDQPFWAYDMIYKFTRNFSLTAINSN